MPFKPAALIGTALLFAAPAAAQDSTPAPAPAPSRSEIIVERSTQKEVREQLWETLETTEGYITTFSDPFCPGVVGLGPDVALALVERVRANAAAAGYDVPEAPCKPNAIIIFANDPQAIVKGLRQKRSGLFESNYTAEIRSLVDQPRPYYAWKVIEERTVDGIPIRDGENRQAQATRLSANVRYDIVGSYIVLDVNKTPGMSVSQLADFVTLHSLIELDRAAADKSQPASILRLFNIDDPALLPDSMSAQDKAMIAGMADDTLARLNAGRQRNRLATTITRELEEQQAPAKAPGDTTGG